MQKFFEETSAQGSMEFILITGGVVVAAIVFYSLSGTFRNLGNVVSNWVASERNITLAKITR